MVKNGLKFGSRRSVSVGASNMCQERHIGVRMISGIAARQPGKVQVGMSVTMVYEDVTTEASTFKFAPA